MIKKIIFVCLFFFFTTSCAFGPLVVHETARTIGNSQHELILGAGRAGYLFKWNYGLRDDVDLGIQFETLSLGVRLKYAWINQNEKGFSLATAAGAGFSIGGSHYYADIIGSYLISVWEPYAAVRIVHVTNDPMEFKKKGSGLFDFRIDESQYNYGQFILGTRLWLSKSWLFSAEVSNIFSLSPSFANGIPVIVSAGLGYKF